MDELMRLLPVIIGILYFIFGGRKKKQQPAKPTRKKPKPSTNTPSLEDILRELQGGQPKAPEPARQKTPVPIPTINEEKEVYVPASIERAKLETNDHSHDFRPEYEHHADLGEKSLRDIRLEIEEDKGILEDDYQEVTNITLRDMILNDAILNRPYS